MLRILKARISIKITKKKIITEQRSYSFCKFTLHIIVGKIKPKSGRNVGRKGKKGGWPEG